MNIIYACLESDQIDEASYYLMIAPQFMNEPLYLYEKIVLDFYKELIASRKSLTMKKNFIKCHNILDILNTYGLASTVNALKKLLV